MDDRREQLIWTELDGELTEAEALELAESRALDEDRNTENEVRLLASRLDAIQPVTAPAELRQSILEAVATPTANATVPTLGDFQARVASAPAWLKWGGLAAGIALAVVAHQLAFGPGFEDTSKLTGTALPVPERQDQALPPLASGAELETGLDFVRLQKRGDLLRVLLTPGVGDFVFAFRGSGLASDGVASPDEAAFSSEATADEIIIRIEGPGRVELSIPIDDPSQVFVLSVFRDGVELFDGEFSLAEQAETNFRGSDR